jgi:hypothetical protein
MSNKAPFVFPAVVMSVFAGACAAPPAHPPTTVPTPRSASWLCAFSPYAVSLQALGVPADSEPIDLALSPEKVTVLLRPARLVSFSRSGLQVVDMLVGNTADSWRAIDRDPTDGSLWVASGENVSFLRIAESGERNGIDGPRVEGQGGFQQIRIGRDAIYATPMGAASAVWRLSRAGKLLGQSFPQEKVRELHPEELGRRLFWLARDLEGSVVGLESGSGELYRVNAEGAWTPADRFPVRPGSQSRARSLRGEAVGTSAEVWYFPDCINGFFFMPGGPVLLGCRTAGSGPQGSPLLRVRDARIETAIENCAGSSLSIVVSDSIGFAAASSSTVTTVFHSGAAGERNIVPSKILLGHYTAGN